MLSLTLEHHDEPDEEIAETLCKVSNSLGIAAQAKLHRSPPASPACFPGCDARSHQYLMTAHPGDNARKLLDAFRSWRDRALAPTLYPR
jgi:hypothetical protein